MWRPCSYICPRVPLFSCRPIIVVALPTCFCRAGAVVPYRAAHYCRVATPHWRPCEPRTNHISHPKRRKGVGLLATTLPASHVLESGFPTVCPPNPPTNTRNYVRGGRGWSSRSGLGYAPPRESRQDRCKRKQKKTSLKEVMKSKRQESPPHERPDFLTGFR